MALFPMRRSVPHRSAGRLARCLAALAFFCAAAGAADLQPRAYAWLMSRSTLVIAGTVENVSGGLFGDGRTASIRVDGLIKGRWVRRAIEVAWNDKEFEETAYKRDARVVVFAVLRKDSTFEQAAPGISCWPIERIGIKGKNVRAAEYVYPLDLLTGVPASALKATESVEQAKNFRMAQRKQWILIDNLLPPVRPYVVPQPPPSRKNVKRAPKTARKPSKSSAAR
jgi:hypothetical protein